MRIRRPSCYPAGSAAPSSTSKELLQRSPRLSRLLHPHSAALTCSTGTATSSPTPRTKPRPTRRHQRGCTLIASHLLLNSTSRHRRCSIPHPHGAATLKPAPRATSPRRLSPSARPLRRRRPYQPDLLLLLWLSLARAAAAALPLARAAALLRFSYTSVDGIAFWVSRFPRGGLAGVKEEPAAAGRGDHRRGTPLSILGFRVGAGGLEGWPGRRWRVVSGR